MQTKLSLIVAVALAAAGVMASGTAQAANYSAGDLLLGFVAGGGQGANETLVVNLGSSTAYRDAFDAGTNSINFLNIGTQLATQFGNTWYDRTDLFISAFGARSATASLTTLVNLDPNRTMYVSQARINSDIPGSPDSGGWSVATDANMTTGSGRMLSTSQRYGDIGSVGDGVGVAIIPDTAANTLDEFTRPTTSTSFGAYNGGIEQTFSVGTWGTLGLASTVEAALDLYRVSPKNNILGQYGYTADNSGIREGVYKGSVTINQAGEVSFIASAIPEPGVAMLGLVSLGAFFRRRRP